MHRDRNHDVVKLVEYNFYLMNEFSVVHLIDGETLGKQVGTKASTRWVRPPQGVVKVNCDASIKNNRLIGIDFIIRDANKGVILSGG